MNSNQQDVLSFIEALYASRHEVAQAYSDGSIDISEDNQSKLRKLQQYQAMRPNPHRENSLRPSHQLVKVLDEAIERLSNLKISVDFSEHIVRLGKLAYEYQQAIINDQVDEQEAFYSEFDGAAFEISEEVRSMLLHVRHAVDNNFANVSSYKDKLRQNEHYIGQLQRLDKTLTALQSPTLLNILASSLDMDVLNGVYRVHIVQNMSEWRSIMLEITAMLESYLNRLRNIEPMARSIRLFNSFLYKHPEYAPREMEEYPDLPDWALLHEGLTFKPSIDIQEPDREPFLVDLARSVERVDIGLKVQRTQGVFLEDDEPLVYIIELSPAEEWSQIFFEEARKGHQTVSAVQFFSERALLDGHELELMLTCLVGIVENSKDKAQNPCEGLDIQRIEVPGPDAWAGNIIIEDVHACLKH